MPLLVHCPTGCVVRMSSNRSGRIVRCPKCKSAIRIPIVPTEELATSVPVPCEARIARRRQSESNQQLEPLQAPESSPVGENDSPKKARLPVPDLVKPQLKRRRSPVEPGVGSDLEHDSKVHMGLESSSEAGSQSNERETAGLDSAPSTDPLVTETVTGGEDTHPAPMFGEAELPGHSAEQSAASIKHAQDQVAGEDAPMIVANSRTTVPRPAGDPPIESNVNETATDQTDRIEVPGPADGLEPGFDFEPLETPRPTAHAAVAKIDIESGQIGELEPLPVLKSFAPVVTRPPDAIEIINLSEPAETGLFDRELINWEQRLQNANSDRRILARVFATCLCFVAIVNMTPALYHWYHWLQLAETMPLPRWIYILIFVGAIHLVYAVFLFQINDWSAMRAVSVAMLVVAFVFGSISTGLLVGESQGNLTGFLGIPFTLNRQACMWCVAMLCLATLMSYWGGKESSNWQRTDDLLKDILARNSA